MKGRPVDQLVFEYMFPRTRTADPQNFQSLVQRHLILEVRQEVHSFYGHLETQEAKYPGLDYSHPIHRIRLSRWQWHRRLFRAFDALRLTPSEIAGLTKWEGTKWAKERYEREQGITIRDTTSDEFADWIEPEHRVATPAQTTTMLLETRGEPVDENMAEDSDEELESVGVDLNMRLRERVALRNVSGDTTVSLDEEWEQWLKQAIETGELSRVADQIAQISGSEGSMTTDDFFPPRIVTAARNGDWDEIPESLQGLLRRSLESERQTSQASTLAQSAVASSPSPAAMSPSAIPEPTVQIGNIHRGLLLAHEYLNATREQQRRTYSALRLPGNDNRPPTSAVSSPGTGIRVQRTAQPGA
jgi:hypothetical protein